MTTDTLKLVQNRDKPLAAWLGTSTIGELYGRKTALANALRNGVQLDEDQRNIRSVLRAIDAEVRARRELANERKRAWPQAKSGHAQKPARADEFVVLGFVSCTAEVAEKIRRHLKVALGETMVENGIKSVHLAVGCEGDTEQDAVPVRALRPHDERVLLERLQAHLARTHRR